MAASLSLQGVPEAPNSELLSLQDHSSAAAGHWLYNLADAAVAAAPAAGQHAAARTGGWVAPISDALESVLKLLQDGLNTLHVPYSYGFSIILLTLIVKLVTFPLTKAQVESQMAVQSLKPRLDLIKDRYGEDKDRISKETSVLYEQAGVNPLAGCVPTLLTIPIFIGLYNSLSNVASEGVLDAEGFFWIPTLAGPTTIAARQAGSGIAWLYPLVDGHPPIGWEGAARYLVLPVTLVLCQYVSTAIMTPPADPKDETQGTAKALSAFLPLMLGFFSLNVPSGLTLYYLANTVLTSLVQVYLKKLGGADVQIKDLGPVTKPGSGRRSGVVAHAYQPWVPTTVLAAAAEKAAADAAAAAEDAETPEFEGAASAAAASAAAAAASVEAIDPATVDRRCKRRRLSTVTQTA